MNLHETEKLKTKNESNLLSNLMELLEKEDLFRIRRELLVLHPSDISELLYKFNLKDQQIIFSVLPIELAAEVLSEMDRIAQSALLEDMNNQHIYSLFIHMDSDDVSALFSIFSEEKANALLSQMNYANSQQIRELLTYPQESAGRMMAKEFIAVYEDQTVYESIIQIKALSARLENIYYIFVINRKGHLIGYISLQDLILASASKKVMYLMKADVISVNALMERDEIVRVAKKYDVPAIAVVDEQGCLVGRITFDDVMDVMEEESAKDISKIVGITEDIVGITEDVDLHDFSTLRTSLSRLPWLIIGIIGGGLAAWIISQYRLFLVHDVEFSFFTPMVMSMGGNVAIQTSSVIFRGISTGELSSFNFLRKLNTELRVSLVNSFVCSFLFFLMTFFLKGGTVAFLMGASLFCIMMTATMIGIAIPLLLRSLSVDPAIAMGPFIIILIDLISLFIYFSFVFLILY